MADKEHDAHGGEAAAAHGGGGGHGGGAHGGGSHEEHEGAPEWLISFADNTALMMGFFVILLGLNMGPKGTSSAAPAPDASSKAAAESGQTAQQLDWALSVRAAFNNPVDIHSSDPRDKVLVMRLQEKLRRLANRQSEDPGLKGQENKTQSVRDTDYHNLYGYLPFDNNAAAITPAAKQTLDEMVQKLKGMKLVIELRGHASAAEAYDRSDRAMRLSFDRALAVAAALSDAGVDWRQLRLIPCGDNDRIRPLAYDRPGHAKNECVEVIVTDEVLAE
jgi:flagellar motor protein MotB